ncbi:hypothetical protein LY76DRAFT_322462 [Colletotrichum caudatum]|nr:hypothetical protein LY76DRAFT_322462 [Colletotrichum caudatum]
MKRSSARDAPVTIMPGQARSSPYPSGSSCTARPGAQVSRGSLSASETRDCHDRLFGHAMPLGAWTAFVNGPFWQGILQGASGESSSCGCHTYCRAGPPGREEPVRTRRDTRIGPMMPSAAGQGCRDGASSRTPTPRCSMLTTDWHEIDRFFPPPQVFFSCFHALRVSIRRRRGR